MLDADQINLTPASLTEYFSVLEDPAQTLSLTEVRRSDIASRFTANHAPAASLNYGYTTSAYWLRFTLKNDTARLLDRMLEISYSDLSDVQFYQPLADGTYQSVATGFAQPFATRPYANRFFVFPVALPEHSEQVYYLRIQSNNGMVVPIRLWEPQAFHSYERKDYSVQAWYFGMVVAIAIFNLLLFFALRDVIYLMYVSYVMSLSLGIAAQNGLALEFLWADTQRWSDISTTACFTLAGGFAVIFIRQMLDTRKNTPRFDRLLRIFAGISLLFPIMYAAPPQTFGILTHEIFNQSLTLFDGVGVILDVGIAIYLSLKHQRSALFFLVAFLLIAIGASISVLRDLGLLPFNTFTVNALQFGSAMEILLMALALADRFLVIRREKEKAQQQLVETLQSSERMLEERVEQRTAELQTLNEALENAESDQRILLSMASHEFRTPAAMIKASLDSLALLKDIIPPEVAQRLENIGQASLRLNRLANNLISFDRMQELALKPKKQLLDLGQLASEVISKYLGNDTPQLQLPKHPVSLQGDSILLSIALHNLIDNALRYHKSIDFPIIVSIEESLAPEDHWIELRVADLGAGIPDTDKELIFQRFYSTQGEQSSGLGLSIVRSIAQAHGGTAFALDNTPRGSVMVIRL